MRENMISAEVADVRRVKPTDWRYRPQYGTNAPSVASKEIETDRRQ